jgi:hypothetical protein
MTTIYTYKFIHHSYLNQSDYHFIVYLAHCPSMYEIVHEFYGPDALKHYQSVINISPQKLQQCLAMISR